MALCRAHTSVKAADRARLLLLNKHRVKHTQCRQVSLNTECNNHHGLKCNFKAAMGTAKIPGPL